MLIPLIYQLLTMEERQKTNTNTRSSRPIIQGQGSSSRTLSGKHRNPISFSVSVCKLIASASRVHSPPPPHQVTRKRNRASRTVNVNESRNGSRDLEGIDSSGQMWMEMELEISSVRGAMIGPHVERRESTLLQLPEPTKYVLFRLPHSVYIS
jgi:hypothetical protein